LPASAWLGDEEESVARAPRLGAERERLVLALFMWGHMFFVSSILISKDAMWTITKMFEGYFFFGKAYPGIVSVVVAVIIVLLVVTPRSPCASSRSTTASTRRSAPHAADAARGHDAVYWQVVTGFAMFFLAGARTSSRC